MSWGGRLLLQRLRENLRAFSFQVADSTLYMIGYKPLGEAGERCQGTMRPCLDWPRLLPGSKVAHQRLRPPG
jgi:hypothetical protein